MTEISRRKKQLRAIWWRNLFFRVFFSYLKHYNKFIISRSVYKGTQIKDTSWNGLTSNNHFLTDRTEDQSSLVLKLKPLGSWKPFKRLNEEDCKQILGSKRYKFSGESNLTRFNVSNANSRVLRTRHNQPLTDHFHTDDGAIMRLLHRWITIQSLCGGGRRSQWMTLTS